MKNGSKYHGAVVPLVTPFTAQGTLDGAALNRLVDSQIAGGVEGIFVLGTTGEGAYVPRALHKKLVELTVKRANKRTLIFVGLGDVRLAEMDRVNEFFQVGADGVVAHPPISEKVPLEKLGGWFKTLLDRVAGPLLIYNMPATTGVSIPLDAVESLLGHPRLAGIKDSENNPQRVEELLKRFGGKKDFSVFIGVGALMEKGLKLGADGIVPSVGNLIPEVCHQLCVAAQTADWGAVESHYARMSAVAALYQKGRTLNESLAALKAAVHCRGLCTPDVLPPLLSLPKLEVEKIRTQMAELQLLNGRA
ncbi:MAG TPA: dihydrodipicolinate synthase family protein [Verrucomicrobiae bacterium]|nr:dihydrodipicolinate synthase family protein [Verrucomicrobiae bacterium]